MRDEKAPHRPQGASRSRLPLFAFVRASPQSLRKKLKFPRIWSCSEPNVRTRFHIIHAIPFRMPYASTGKRILLVPLACRAAPFPLRRSLPSHRPGAFPLGRPAPTARSHTYRQPTSQMSKSSKHDGVASLPSSRKSVLSHRGCLQAAVTFRPYLEQF